MLHSLHYSLINVIFITLFFIYKEYVVLLIIENVKHKASLVATPHLLNLPNLTVFQTHCHF